MVLMSDELVNIITSEAILFECTLSHPRIQFNEYFNPAPFISRAVWSRLSHPSLNDRAIWRIIQLDWHNQIWFNQNKIRDFCRQTGKSTTPWPGEMPTKTRSSSSRLWLWHIECLSSYQV